LKATAKKEQDPDPYQNVTDPEHQLTKISYFCGENEVRFRFGILKVETTVLNRYSNIQNKIATLPVWNIPVHHRHTVPRYHTLEAFTFCSQFYFLVDGNVSDHPLGIAKKSKKVNF
jgi:hypothetical protein